MKPYRSLKRSLLGAAAIAALAPPALAAGYNWNIGNFSSSGVPGSLGTADTLDIGYGNYKYFDTGLANAGTVNWVDTLYFLNGNTVSNSGLWNAIADSALADGGNSGNFVNSGIFRKSGGSTTTIGGIAFTNSGSIDAQVGAIVFAGGNATFNAGSQFTGAGQVQVTNNAVFNGAFNSQNLQLLAGTYTGNAAQINGSVDWVTGVFAGSWQVAAGQALNLRPGNYHYLNGSLANAGTFSTQDTLYFLNGNTLTNQGLTDLQADAGFGDGGNGGTFINQGSLRKSGGTGASNVSGIAFVNAAGGVIDVQTGSLNFASNNASFNAGTHFIGAGQAQVTSNASFNGAFDSQNLQLLAGTYTGNAAQLNGSVNWVTGSFAGSWEVAAGQTLKLQTGSYHYLNGSLTNRGTMAAQDWLYLQNGNTLTNQGLYDLQVDVGVNDGGNGGNFVNNGVLRKSGGLGSSVVTGIAFTNNGEINAQTGSINFAGGSLRFNGGTAFTGTGSVLVSTNASFVGAFATAGNLTLAAGNYVGGDGTPGSKGVMNGDTKWTTGALTGAWELAAGRTLTMQPGNYHFVNGSVSNLGTVAAQDWLYLQNGNTFTNQALYELQADVGLNDGGNGGNFINNGILRKSGGAGSSVVLNIGFTNNGEINAQSGTINFAGGALRFNQGTAFTGPAQVLVSGNASFVGAYTTANNLTLASGSFIGGDGTPGSKGVMNGNTNWSTGALAGSWDVAAGRTLTALPGNYHYVNGSVSNHGTLLAQDTLYLQNGNTLANQGLVDLQGDVGVADGGNNGHFINTGLLLKSAGGGTSSLAQIDFVNAAGGVVDVRSGTIQLPGNFNNGGTLKGTGAYGSNLLSNAGHVAPGSIGAAPGLLTVNGNFAQGAPGSFDVGLQDLGTFGQLWVNGTASLGGTLEVDCFGSCSFSAGTELVILHSTGALSGTFGPLTTSGFAAGAFEVAYIGNDVVLRITQGTVAAVPEPASYAMLLAGLGALGFIARRRRAG